MSIRFYLTGGALWLSAGLAQVCWNSVLGEGSYWLLVPALFLSVVFWTLLEIVADPRLLNRGEG